MPNNCSTLIQRKQNILDKILRSRSERKPLNAVTENTPNLRLSVNRKSSDHSPSPNHLATDSAGSSPTRRSTIFTTNRVQPANDHIYEKHLPTIRDITATFVQPHRLYGDTHTRSRPKTPIGNASPKSAQRSLSVSISSIFNTLSKRSAENLTGSNGDIAELKITSSRRARQSSNDSSKYGTENNHTTTTTARQINVTPLKHSVESGHDTRYPANRPETSHQQRTPMQSARLRLNVPNVQVESPLTHELLTKEQINTGTLYQRRPNNSIRSPIKQKIDKYRRRSEETTQAGNGNTNAATNGFSPITLALGSPSSTRSRPQPSPPSARRITSDAENHTRPEVFRLSMESSPIQTDRQQQSSSQRLKSAHIYSARQQLAPAATPHTTSLSHRRSQTVSPAAPVQHRLSSNNVKQRQSRQSSAKQSTIAPTQGNLYLAFIASRHLSTLEETVPDCDIDHPRLIRIFTWLENVEEHRHEQADHQLLLAEEHRRMEEADDNYSLYSEIQHAVDDLPANTSGEPCERIATIAFED